MFASTDSNACPSRGSQMISAEDLERLLRHTKYSSHYDDDSEGDEEAETILPLCLPTPLLLIGEDDVCPHAAGVVVVPPHPTGCVGQRDTAPPCAPCVCQLDDDAVSQSENNISETPVEAFIPAAAAPPAYTPADSTRVGAEVDCCHAIEKSKVKTVMCLNYMHGRRCRFGAHCAFAHGADELRQAPPEMMAKKQAIVSSSKPLLTETPPPSYRDSLAAPAVESAALGATPAYEVAVREQSDHLPPPLPAAEERVVTDVAETPSVLGAGNTAAVGARCGGTPKPQPSFPARQRAQGTGNNARLLKTQPRRVKRSPV